MYVVEVFARFWKKNRSKSEKNLVPHAHMIGIFGMTMFKLRLSLFKKNRSRCRQCLSKFWLKVTKFFNLHKINKYYFGKYLVVLFILHHLPLFHSSTHFEFKLPWTNFYQHTFIFLADYLKFKISATRYGRGRGTVSKFKLWSWRYSRYSTYSSRGLTNPFHVSLSAYRIDLNGHIWKRHVSESYLSVLPTKIIFSYNSFGFFK